MKNRFSIRILLIATAVCISGVIFWFSPLHQKLEVHSDIWMTRWRVYFQPVHEAPTVQATQIPTLIAPTITTTSVRPETRPTHSATQSPTPNPTASPTNLPEDVRLNPPRLDTQDWNNCGPETLATYLRYYGWEGTQNDIAKQIKPQRADRNVNIDELAGYVNQNVGWLRTTYRVGGSLSILRSLLAEGVPVLIEESFTFEGPFWYQDDLWGGHYLLLTGYNDSTQNFITQDSDRGANRKIEYKTLDANWQAFNRVYLIVYRLEDEERISNLMAKDWDTEQNRQNALETARIESGKDPENPFTWFNLGTNLVYFERYAEAAGAYDQARAKKMPQRMLRYQFGPFLAYFHSGRLEDLNALVEYAIKVSPNSEEAYLWKGWALYRQGKKNEAISAFSKALEARPGYADALYAINYIKEND